VTAWSCGYEGFDPAREGLREALCTLGNGYMATRGAGPECRADGVHYPGTYIAGCYNTLSDEVDGQRVENESLVNVPNWLPLTFRAKGGDWFDPAAVHLLEYRQWLDLRRGILHRLVRFRDGRGRTTRLEQDRFVHMRYPHLCGLRTVILPEDWSGRIDVRSALDGSVQNTGVARYRALSARHHRTLRAEAVAGHTLLLEAETVRSHIRVALAARTRVLLGGALVDADASVTRRADWVGHDLGVHLGRGQPAIVEKIVGVFTSRDHGISEPAAAATDWVARAGGFGALAAQHEASWRQFWRRSRVQFAGSDEMLRAARLNSFHIAQTLCGNSVDLDAGVPARGLHGEGYRGHILWDELFVLPLINVRLPSLARALLDYRYRRLPQARWAAREAGYQGAMYPWQSGSDGHEASQRTHLNPVSGHWLPDPTYRQRHIGIAVAYNVWQYYQATGDLEFLATRGAEMILEVARFWASIAAFEPRRGRYVIRGVMGPDEYHTGYPDRPWDGVDNNAYTNVMAVWVLRRALEVLDLLPQRRRAELTETLGLDARQTNRWRAIARRMFVPFHDDGIISQFEGYERLAELDWDGYRAKYPDIRRLDRILEAQGDSPNRYKASKQADVLMLFYLLSADVLGDVLAQLGYRWDCALIPKNVDYYLARTSHGSTLSAVVHAWVLARGHREHAIEYFTEALESDVADVQGGTTAEGIHLAAMAGSLDVLQRCFAGVETRNDTLFLNPCWPTQLGTLTFAMRYREHTLTLRVTGRRVTVSADAGPLAPVRLSCRGSEVLLSPGGTATFPADPMPTAQATVRAE
jgi:trehalose 6-phosphate phosphatase